MATDILPLLRLFGPAEPCLKSLETLADIAESVVKEPCYYIDFGKRSTDSVSSATDFLQSLLGDGLVGCDDCNDALETTQLAVSNNKQMLIEIGPKLRHRTPWCTNVVSVCTSAGVRVSRVEHSAIYLVTMKTEVTQELRKKVLQRLHDPIMEEEYVEPIESFLDSLPAQEKTWEEVQLMNGGIDLLREVNTKHAFGFDDADITYYHNLFTQDLKRNPTLVELCDLAQSNSEHSRHWFFKGKYTVDGEELPVSLWDMVKSTNQGSTNYNNVIKFDDNSSAILGFVVPILEATNPSLVSALQIVRSRKDLILTAETHNFPTGVAPFSGAATGTGGRLRDIMAVGRGGIPVAGMTGYCVGQLHIPGYEMKWERSKGYEGDFESPLKIIIDASNGASDYGNKFGEPVIGGFFRAFGGKLDTEWREWVKPIMFSAGIGILDEENTYKKKTRSGQVIGKLGGPAYRIGMGGGSASSVEIQGEIEDRTKNAVQRGDPEMQNKLNRVVRACAELRDENPILSIHDQGAGGNANVLKELVMDCGGAVSAKSFTVGDTSLSLMELWCAEYQESNAILFARADQRVLEQIARRERCTLDAVGVTVDGMQFKFIHCKLEDLGPKDKCPVDFPLDKVFAKMPQKEYHWTTRSLNLTPFMLKDDVDIFDALLNVLKLPSVASKRFLTSKVDRSVTGLIAQQQCVGALQVPLADFAVTACSFFDTVGTVTTIGEQPIITMVDPAAGARMSVIEAIASMAGAPISDLKDVKCSVNWMWPAKLVGEGYAMYEACKGLCDLLILLGVGIDGGKDSLGMAAKVPVPQSAPDGKTSEIVKAPGTVVVTAYAPCRNINKLVTPDLKGPRKGIKSHLLWVRPTFESKSRLGGSALAQVFGQLGMNTPDIGKEDLKIFIETFKLLNEIAFEDMLLAIHDVSEGGVLTCLVEMAIAGWCGVEVNFPVFKNTLNLAMLFAEEVGWIIEVADEHRLHLQSDLSNHYYYLGTTTKLAPKAKVCVKIAKETVFAAYVEELSEAWEETSYRLDRIQTDKKCAEQEYRSLKNRNPAPYECNFKFNGMEHIDTVIKRSLYLPRVAVIREEGCNGDREMAAAFIQAGFLVYDVTMTDLIDLKADLNNFRGIAFPGGFSYADVLGGAIGWAASIKGNYSVRLGFKRWRSREDTFSIGICNGCQLMSLLGWNNLETTDLETDAAPAPDYRFKTNLSRRFESRWVRVKINASNCIFLAGMDDAVLGVWAAHGEGRFVTDAAKFKKFVEDDRIVATYVDDENKTTLVYPFNPNGSMGGVAALTSDCGHHLSIMPHPERCFMPWQWPDLGPDPEKLTSSRFRQADKPIITAPWAKLFQNAYDWIQEDSTSPWSKPKKKISQMLRTISLG